MSHKNGKETNGLTQIPLQSLGYPFKLGLVKEGNSAEIY